MTGGQLGAAAGIGDAGRVSALESGSRPVTEENLAKVAEVLGVSLPWIRYGVVTDDDIGRIRTESYGVGWRAALEQVETAVRALREGEPGAVLTDALRVAEALDGVPTRGRITGTGDRAAAEEAG